MDRADAPRHHRSRSHRIAYWVLTSVAGLSVILALLVLVSVKTFQHFFAKMPDPILTYNLERSVKAQIQGLMPVEISLDRALPVKLSKVLEFEIPIRKNVEVLIDDNFTVPVEATLAIPIDQDVYVETEVPVNTSMTLEGAEVHTRLWGFKEISLPLSGSVPIRTVFPLRQPVHIRTRADVRISESVRVHVKKLLTLPLDLKVRVKLPIDDIFDIRVADNIAVKARIPEQIPVDVQVPLAVSKQGTLIEE
jgi:hypothetical protein